MSTPHRRMVDRYVIRLFDGQWRDVPVMYLTRSYAGLVAFRAMQRLGVQVRVARRRFAKEATQ